MAVDVNVSVTGLAVNLDREVKPVAVLDLVLAVHGI